MSNKYIKLSFKNAKLFPKNTKTKDFVSTVDVNTKGRLYFNSRNRSLCDKTSFKEFITVHQVSNVLHTLIGERPIPSFRKTFYGVDETTFSLASKSFLKIDSVKSLKNIKGESVKMYIDEFTKVNKSPWNSYSKQSTIQWFKIVKYMGKYYDEFITSINDSLGYDVTKEPFENLLNLYEKEGSRLDTTIEFLLSKNKTPIVNFLTKEVFDRSEITKNVLLGETVTSGIDKVYSLHGEILIPYNQSFVDRLIKNSTNILDGGIVKIIGVFYEDELNNTHEFVAMSEISDEKY